MLRRNLKKGKESYERDQKSLETCINEVERLDGIISHFLKAIRPQTPDFKKINILHFKLFLICVAEMSCISFGSVISSIA